MQHIGGVYAREACIHIQGMVADGKLDFVYIYRRHTIRVPIPEGRKPKPARACCARRDPISWESLGKVLRRRIGGVLTSLGLSLIHI